MEERILQASRAGPQDASSDKKKDDSKVNAMTDSPFSSSSTSSPSSSSSSEVKSPPTSPLGSLSTELGDALAKQVATSLTYYKAFRLTLLAPASDGQITMALGSVEFYGTYREPLQRFRGLTDDALLGNTPTASADVYETKVRFALSDRRLDSNRISLLESSGRVNSGLTPTQCTNILREAGLSAVYTRSIPSFNTSLDGEFEEPKCWQYLSHSDRNNHGVAHKAIIQVLPTTSAEYKFVAERFKVRFYSLLLTLPLSLSFPYLFVLL